MAFSFRSLVRSDAFQIALLTLSLWLLGLMQLEKDPSDFSFQLIFAMLAPHIFSGRRVFASLIVYLLIIVALGIPQMLVGKWGPPPSISTHTVSLIAATAVSALFVRKRPGPLFKVLLALYYIGALYLSALHSITSRLHILWVVLLLLIPPLLLLRMKRYVSRFWQAAVPILIYIPINSFGYLLMGQAGAFSVGTAPAALRLWDTSLMFARLALPFPAYLFLAIIAAVVLTNMDDWLRRDL